jgi:hypothetical protein
LTAEETQARFDDFNAAVIQFYQDAQLKTRFEKDYQGLYAKLMNEVRSVAPGPEFIEAAEAYYGMQRDAYEIIVSAFSFNGIGKAKLISSSQGSKAVSLVTSNHLLESDTIDLEELDSFTIGYRDEKYFQEIGLHELIHTFFHEALKENQSNIARINELEYLFTDSLRDAMRSQGYVDWRTCFEEHLVRVGEVRIAERLGNERFVASYREECIQDRGFVYFELIESLFQAYENDRKKYPDIGAFIPDLVDEMKLRMPE